MSIAMLTHDANNLRAVRAGYEYLLGEDINAEHCSEVIRMIEAGTLTTKAQVETERRKRGIERK